MSSRATEVHPLAYVSPAARLGQGVRIGPFCTVGPDVTLGDGVELISHVNIDGITTIGARTVVHPFASLGTPPQDLSYKGEPTTTAIGEDCVIRESVTVNRGTPKSGATVIGDRCFLMAYAHVAHDCRVGNNVIFANAATIGGHVKVGDFVFLGGLCAVHQFTRIGDFAMVGGVTGVKDDVIPYGMAFGANGTSGELIGLNVVGMKRRGLSRDDVRQVRACYETLFYGAGTFAERVADATAAYADHPAAGRLIAFIAAEEKRPIMMAAPKKTRVAGTGTAPADE
ncbi:acyl-ACP--UDP-N-acetylglucosamine O-acyltransferase [Phreatobacter oligotrophus]|jgi:UDP-N-acetylglucosamine acyltransferase|uniref:acyl-ACP--UDP-N-acetylglucosamine O-acyltransferase n=1 Tax=Phreatobacter oligotrophus TaxID=1122261 RepID=UPI0023524CB9|nr:acyl-ACP--UDP-N-acetylglucosamine O-acyltransferase [Phreatobacter oligotrophus]MBX9989851.1 acyl-ACP--UDP-N-acetylglucosamine O-acyltransferase [Phreatobacter oligotrophus]